MVVSVVTGYGNLHPSTENQRQAIFWILAEFDFANHQSGCDEGLILAVMGAAKIEGGVCLQLGPEYFADYALNHSVPRKAIAIVPETRRLQWQRPHRRQQSSRSLDAALESRHIAATNCAAHPSRRCNLARRNRARAFRVVARGTFSPYSRSSSEVFVFGSGRSPAKMGPTGAVEFFFIVAITGEIGSHAQLGIHRLTDHSFQ
jgi:hypothetical protein